MAPLNVVNEQKPREIALRVLQQRRAGGEFIENLLETALVRARLSPADRALCQEIVYGVVRWEAVLDWLIARKTDGRAQKPALQNLLRLGLYQIFRLDRIPDHAAVYETVELAKQNGFVSQAGFVNAVLRGYLREADETKKLLAELKISQPALGHSHPEWLQERWKSRWGAERAAQLMDWNNTPPKTFARVNRLKTDAGRLLEKWCTENVEYDFVRSGGRQTAAFLAEMESSVPHCGMPKAATLENLVFELKSHPPLSKLESFRQGWFYVQDPGTLLAVCELDPQPGETILDFCAAPGGKTTFIAQLMQNQGRLVAHDVSADRLRMVQKNCQRLGVTCVKTVLPSALDSRPSTFDRILVDVPCSNTGVMRRRVDLRWRIQLQEIERLCNLQLDLLKQAALKLKPGGVLVYSTCSLEPEENSEVVKQFLRQRADFKLERERELLPFQDGVDGVYVARLKKDR
jgi:16S rRNA (cytosine967-C5)-methyltransferase